MPHARSLPPWGSIRTLNLPPDGSQDDAIHCFKADGPCPEGRDLLKTKVAEINAQLEQQTDDDEDSTYTTDQEYDSSDSDSSDDS